MFSKAPIIFFLILGITNFLFAQETESDPPQPTKPYIQPPPNGSTWSVKWTYEREKKTEGDDSPPAIRQRKPRLAKIVFTDKIAKLSVRWTRGGSTEAFITKDKTLYFAEETRKAYISQNDNDSLDATTGLYIFGFHATEWVDSVGKFSGIEQVEGVPCYVFTADGQTATPDSDDPNAPTQGRNMPASTAYISVDTKFPVRVVMDDYATLEFSSPIRTDENISLPRPILEKIEGMEKRQKALQHLRANSR